MKITGQVIHREIAGEHIVVPVGETALKLHGMITLTESGRLLWDCLQEECSVEDLVRNLRSEYDVDENTAREDVLAFIDKLAAIGILEGGDQ